MNKIEELEFRNDMKNMEGLSEIIGIIKTKEKVKWSEEVDEIVYGD